jgi:hypothetical protein
MRSTSTALLAQFRDIQQRIHPAPKRRRRGQ